MVLPQSLAGHQPGHLQEVLEVLSVEAQDLQPWTWVLRLPLVELSVVVEVVVCLTPELLVAAGPCRLEVARTLVVLRVEGLLEELLYWGRWDST